MAAVSAAVDALVAANHSERVGSIGGGSGEQLDGGGEGEVAHALQTLVVLLSTLLRHPSEARYRRLNTQNANLKRLLQLAHSTAVLRSLGFDAESSGDGGTAAAGSPSGFWVWRDGQAPAAADLEVLAAMRDLLARRAASTPLT